MTHDTVIEQLICDSLKEAQDCLAKALADKHLHAQIAAAATCIVTAFQAGGKVISCGNGGSMSDAMHFAEELSGRYRESRKALPAMAISDPGHLTCTANDFGYQHVFARFVEAHFTENDVLLGISTSGKSPNVIEAAKAAAARGGKIIALTGENPNELAPLATVLLSAPSAPSGWADRTQEMHIKIIHILIQLIEQQLFGEHSV